jgi:hypothetical protein
MTIRNDIELFGVLCPWTVTEFQTRVEKNSTSNFKLEAGVGWRTGLELV